MPNPNFRIVRIDPVYCQFTDGILGSKANALPMTYFNKEYAEKLAGFMERRDYEQCGDSIYRVIDLEENRQSSRRGFQYTRPTPQQIALEFKFDYITDSAGEEIPF